MIQRSFRYYLYMHSVLSRFDNGAIFPVRFLTFLLSILCAIWLNVLVKFIFFKNKVSSDRLTIVFSTNQYRIASWLKSKGIKLDIYSFGDLSAGSEINFTHKFIFLCALANYKHTIPLIYKSFNDEVLKSNFQRVIKLCGIQFILVNGFKFPKQVFNFNDHSPANVLFHDIAKSFGSKLIYMQHAPVSDKFPPLYHDLNILFSDDSLRKYQNPENKNVIRLYDPRFELSDSILNLKSIPKTVLLCTNLLDDKLSIKKLLDNLLIKGYVVTIRPHPRDNRDFSYGGKYQISKELNSFKDIGKSEVVIANESAILLESIVMQRLTYKAKFLSIQDIGDNYGYISSGLILKEYDKSIDLINDLESNIITYNLDKASHFVGDLNNREKIVIKLKEYLLTI